MEKELKEMLTTDFEVELEGGLMEQIRLSGTTTTYAPLIEGDVIRFFESIATVKSSTRTTIYDYMGTHIPPIKEPEEPVEKSTEYPVERMIQEKLLNK